ncbi:tyrosine-type recombinase/integrase [Geomonas nitrogeniifigens]|uniref:tyrosine-type recombinase/integrase n=1 Tax=Geomonas diazotrophica TaxID=2843197 RepID=UPI001C2C693D|nr:tyrosine-type recombinase/integrase [Geomonas nitrogeniifigens]QXE85577.1 tyrosine-type recombinase/integrase [Geomonas nitrogeniifigens]
MAGIYRRGTTYYAMYYIGAKKHRKSLDTDDLKIAKARLRKLEDELDAGSDTPFPTKTSIPVVLEAYIQHMLSYRDARSVNRDLSPMRIMFGEVCAPLKVKNRKIAVQARKKVKSVHLLPLEASCFEALTARIMSEWLAEHMTRNCAAPKTGNRYREILQKMFSWAIDVYGIKFPGGDNPALKIKRWREGAPVVAFLTLEDIAKQLQVLQDTSQLQVMVAVYIFAGLRREEAMWLQKNDVDLEVGFIRIHSKVVLGRSWQPKNGKNRVIPISSELRAYLENYTPRASDGDWFFPSPGGRWWDPDNFSGRALAPVNKANGLRWGCDEFRHTFGSQLAMAGTALQKISKLMGNSVQICERHYIALLPDSLIDCVEFPKRGATATPLVHAPLKVQIESGRPQLRLVISKP